MIINISYFFNKRNIILGYSPNGIPFYKNKKQNIDNWITVDNKKIYCGIKWQCVEYVRRYLILTYGISFENVKNAYDIFKKNIIFYKIKDESLVGIKKYINGLSKTMPKISNLIVWNGDDNFLKYGHVAVIVNIIGKNLYICEQNFNERTTHQSSNKNYSRCLMVDKNENGMYYIYDKKYDNILGWVNVNY